MSEVERYIAIDNVCAWPNLTLLPDGTIVAVIFGHSRHLLGEDDGHTWTRSSPISSCCRGETTVLRLAAGRWLAASRTEADSDGRVPDVGMELYVSSDEGVSWKDAGGVTGPGSCGSGNQRCRPGIPLLRAARRPNPCHRVLLQRYQPTCPLPHGRGAVTTV